MSRSRIRGVYSVGRVRISLAREGQDEYPSGRLQTPAEAAALFLKTAPDDGREHFRVVFLTARHIPIAITRSRSAV